MTAPTRESGQEARNKALVREATAAIFGKKDLAAIDRFVALDYIQHNPSAPPGRDGDKQFFAKLFAAIPDLVVTVDHLYAEGDRVFAFMTWRGTHQQEIFGFPGSGRAVTIRTAEIFRVAGGMLAEHWDVVDMSELARQTASTR
jgi:steroid delta-isomerase-like uncharacterized protein